MGITDTKDAERQKPQPATFEFKNIGPVKDAELELGDLTIIAGRNNTGKTYIAYTLYGFLKMFEEWPELVDDADLDSGTPHYIKEMLAKKMREIVRAEHTVDRELRHEMRSELMREMTQAFSGPRLPDVFSSPRSAFQGAALDVRLGADFSRDERRFETTVSDGTVLSLKYDGRNVTLHTKQGKQRHSRFEINEALSSLYLQFLFPELPSNTFILSAERFGISLFYRELDFTKNQLVDVLKKWATTRHWAGVRGSCSSTVPPAGTHFQ